MANLQIHFHIASKSHVTTPHQNCQPERVLMRGPNMYYHNFFTTKNQKADIKIFVRKFSKTLSPSYVILKIQRLEGKQCRFRCGGSS